MARYHLSELALADLDQIWGFIARDNPAAARNTISRILDACDKLADFPGMGASCDELRARMRSYPVRPYVVFYFPRDGGIDVARVIHGARDHPAQFSGTGN